MLQNFLGASNYSSNDRKIYKYWSRVCRNLAQGYTRNRETDSLFICHFSTGQAWARHFFLYVSVCYLEVNIKCLCKALRWGYMYLGSCMNTPVFISHSGLEEKNFLKQRPELSIVWAFICLIVSCLCSSHSLLMNVHIFLITVCVNGQIQSVWTVRKVQKWKNKVTLI